MIIEKAKLIKALKQVSIFVGKKSKNQSASLIHFINENNKAMIFATDFFSVGKTYFETNEPEKFEFCIEYAQLNQVTKIRNKEINVEIFKDKELPNGEKASGIEFFDEKTKFTWALKDPEELIELEEKTIIPEDVPFVEINAKLFKNALKEAGYARDEKNTQNPFITGVNFIFDGKNISFASTDRHRIACWKQELEETKEEQINGIFSPKIIQSVALFNDDEQIKIYVTENQIILVSDSMEAYATKINCDYPDINKFFEKPILSSYEISSDEVMESLTIIDGINTTSLRLQFEDDKVKITAKNEFGDNVEDYFSCKKTSGTDKDDIHIDPVLFTDIFKNINNTTMVLEFREMSKDFKILSYLSDDGSFGMLAPQRR